MISGNLVSRIDASDLGSVRRLLKSVRYASDRAAMTRQLLTFSRRHMLNPRTVDINGVLERTRVLIEHSIPENIRLEFALQGDPRPARIDVSEFEAAMLNVVVNARDAMPGGGTLRFSVHDVVLGPDDGETDAPQVMPGRHVEVRVEDTGCGMSPETLARVYEPFFTTKEVGKGTGLGLSQVAACSSQADRSPSAASRGAGRYRCSCRARRGHRRRRRPARRHVAGQRAATILIVEDDPDVRRTSIAMLQELGHQILIARNAAEGLALLQAGNPIDILFTDVVMPGGMSGVELANQALARSRRSRF